MSDFIQVEGMNAGRTENVKHALDSSLRLNGPLQTSHSVVFSTRSTCLQQAIAFTEVGQPPDLPKQRRAASSGPTPASLVAV
jgi:hypothetical protein